jgi:hypothetical protein
MTATPPKQPRPAPAARREEPELNNEGDNISSGGDERWQMEPLAGESGPGKAAGDDAQSSPRHPG